MSLSHKVRMWSQAFSRIFARCGSCSSGVIEGKGWLWRCASGISHMTWAAQRGELLSASASSVVRPCSSVQRVKKKKKINLEVELLRLVYRSSNKSEIPVNYSSRTTPKVHQTNMQSNTFL